MLMILSEKTGKFLYENRYPLTTKKTGMKVTYNFTRDPEATFSDYVKIGDHANAAEFATKIGKKLGEPCRAVIIAMGDVVMNWHASID